MKLTSLLILLVSTTLIASGCSLFKPPRPVIPPEVTKLPEKPDSAKLECFRLTDDEIIKCIKDPESRDVCRKLEINCARYDNLKRFVNRTWKDRDGK